MGVLRLLIFDRHHECRYDRIYTNDYEKRRVTEDESMQLIMGSTYSLRSILPKLTTSPRPPTLTFSYSTDKYKLQYYESASQWKFILLCTINASSTYSSVSTSIPWDGVIVSRDNVLEVLYGRIFSMWIVMNPLVDLYGREGEVLDGLNGDSAPSQCRIDTFHSNSFNVKTAELFALSIFN